MIIFALPGAHAIQTHQLLNHTSYKLTPLNVFSLDTGTIFVDIVSLTLLTTNSLYIVMLTSMRPHFPLLTHLLPLPMISLMIHHFHRCPTYQTCLHETLTSLQPHQQLAPPHHIAIPYVHTLVVQKHHWLLQPPSLTYPQPLNKPITCLLLPPPHLNPTTLLQPHHQNHLPLHI